MQKRITVCQAMTLARLYRWTVGLTAKDMICAPSMLLFGMTKVDKPVEVLANYLSQIGWCADKEMALQEVSGLEFMPKGEIKGVVLSPLAKGLYMPDVVTIYGNPAQIMRAVQAWTFMHGALVKGLFAGKASCSDYVIAPYLTGECRVSIPGNGDRVMSTTQDNEMAFAFPGPGLSTLVDGLRQAGKRVGARFPVLFYQNFQPEFPAPLREWVRAVEP